LSAFRTKVPGTSGQETFLRVARGPPAEDTHRVAMDVAEQVHERPQACLRPLAL